MPFHQAIITIQSSGLTWGKGTSHLDFTCMNEKSKDALTAKTIKDEHKGRFTAQFRGIYFFSYWATTWDLHPSTVVKMTKNGQVVSASVFNSGLPSSAKYSIHVKATLLMEAGDVVAVQDYKQDANGSLAITQHSINSDYNFIDPSFPGNVNLLKATRGTFSGFLLSALHGNSSDDATR